MADIVGNYNIVATKFNTSVHSQLKDVSGINMPHFLGRNLDTSTF